MSELGKYDKMLKVKNKYKKSQNPLDAACFDIISLNYHNKTLSDKCNEYEQQLKQTQDRLKDAESVIEFYSIVNNWRQAINGGRFYIISSDDVEHRFFTRCESSYYGGKLAREYKAKYGVSE